MDDKWLTDFIEESIPLWLNDPVLFFREVLEFEPDDWQVEAAHNIRTHNRVAIKSGQGVGKTAFEAGIFLWFLTCYYNARVVATAPTQQQLHDVLWSEVAKWMNNSPLLPALLKWTKTYVYVKGYEKRWFAVARTANKPENMQGFHEDNMLFIVDEASGVADPIMEAIMGTLSGDNNKLLMCGNPTKTTGTFYDAFTVDRAIFALQTVSSRDSKRTNKDNIASLDRKYGKDSNVVRVRVDGKFPEQEDDVFIPASWIEDSISTEMEKETALAFGVYISESGEKIRDVRGVLTIDIGCDVARFGDDRTCITFKINEVVRIYKKYNGKNTVWTSGTICQLYNELRKVFCFSGVIPVKIDDGGVGGGVTDQLKAAKKANPELYGNMEVVPVNFGQRIRHKRFYDSTTYMMGVIRDMIQPFDEEGNQRKAQLILPNDNDMVGQLSCRKYDFVETRQKVESKAEMKKRGLSSPDEADSVLLAVLPVNTKKRGEKK